MTKILIIGTLPETAGLGGVTIHIQRFLQFLQKEQFHDYKFLDYKKTSKKDLFKEIRKYRYCHLHLSNPYFRLVITFWAWLFGTKIISTFHGNYGHLKFWKRSLLNITLMLTHTPIVINEPSYAYCKKKNSKTTFLPAFIPPIDDVSLSPEIVAQIEKIKDSGKTLITTNASTYAFDKDGNEIYGLDFLINYMKKVEDLYLLISDPSGKNKAKYGEGTENIAYIPYPHNYFEILKRADICIRNTSTDGDSLTVKESLYVGCRTICTDVVNRPKGCILFHYNDKESLDNAIQTAMQKNTSPATIENGAVAIKSLYENLA